MPHIKLSKGVVIVLKKDTGAAIKFVREFGVEFHARNVVLTPDDKRALQAKEV